MAASGDCTAMELYLYSDWFVFVQWQIIFVQRQIIFVRRLVCICAVTNLYYALRLFWFSSLRFWMFYLAACVILLDEDYGYWSIPGICSRFACTPLCYWELPQRKRPLARRFIPKSIPKSIQMILGFRFIILYLCIRNRSLTYWYIIISGLYWSVAFFSTDVDKKTRFLLHNQNKMCNFAPAIRNA